MEAIRERRRPILIGLVILVLLCLVGVLIFRIFTEGDDDVARETSTPSPTATEGPVVIVTPEEDEDTTPTPTRVISEDGATPTPTEEVPTAEPSGPTATPTAAATNTPTPTQAPTSVASDISDISDEVQPRITNVLENGDFEQDFDDQGVARGWDSFKNDSVVAAFSAEAPGPFVASGSRAQRISLSGATQPDRYAGIYQQVQVVPNRPYMLELHGQIRTGFGDVNQSSYGYRMQYAISQRGITDWRAIPDDNWIELPWDEQPLGSPNVDFSDFTTQVTPTSNRLTLFVRAWNKWADPGLVEYTLDDVSLVGPAPGTVAEAEDRLVDGGLPVTGIDGAGSFISDGRFWGAIVILLLLAVGAVSRGKWGY